MGGLVLPLIAIAYAAVVHARTEKRKNEHESYRRIFEISGHLGEHGPTASKIIALYELRKFPAYKDAIATLCDLPVNAIGREAEVLKAEMVKTKKAFDD